MSSAVMFFNDGWWYLDPEAAVRAAIALDNLAADGSVPPMISVFVDPGTIDVDGAVTPLAYRWLRAAPT
ncbi:hypothetical protein CQ042_11040 [Microbacterium sp. MYb62]|nr:hypothetical protein CQ042_11040 [Microbacterium sp. MYb62]